MPDAANTPAGEPLSQFLAEVRRPLEFLAGAGPGTAARTRVPGQQLAARGRVLATHLRGRALELLETLCERLSELDRLPAAASPAHAAACLTLLGELALPSPSRRPPAAAVYRRSEGGVAAALERLGRPVQFARDVGPRRAALLTKFGIATIEDLLYHLPFRYEDRRLIRDVASVQPGEEASLLGEIVQVAERQVGRGRRRILEGVLRDATGLLGLTWYHQVAYFRSRFTPGQRCLVYGRVERSPGGGKRIVHPEIETNPDEHGAAIQPVYEKPTSLSVAAMRKIAQQAVREHADAVPSVLPASVAEAAGLCDAATALRDLHLPERAADVAGLNRAASPAHRALVFDELFFLQLGLGLKRRQTELEVGLPLPRTGALTDRLTVALPFSLTRAQQRVLDEIHADQARPHPMHRLVQGDVGSGKTIVALFAALTAIENGCQAAFMAPTELLAEQHFATIARFAEGLGIRTALLTGEAVRGRRARAYAGLASGEIQLAVGTHALIQAGVRMPRLGIGVIDEQHRFGVLQRAALRELRGDGASPDILLMTATPIPRTLAMTVYGDLDVSTLDELPPGRKPVRTEVVNEAARRPLYQRVLAHLAQGRQAYIVYPLIEASEKEDLRDAKTMKEQLGESVFRDYEVALLHGRMKTEDKDGVMRRFRAGAVQVLFSTTVIEVGVDVPNATVMVVEHAERFGLSQLHQLRGRVGRGSADAVCFLVAPYLPDAESDTYKRLQAMVRTTDGFKIAAVDLELRGPGDFLGTRQHGLPDFRVASLIRDTRTLAEAREAAERWLAVDPRLESSESAPLRAVLQHRWKGRLGLVEIG